MKITANAVGAPITDFIKQKDSSPTSTLGVHWTLSEPFCSAKITHMIATGKMKLLTIENIRTICKVSRSTVIRWMQMEAHNNFPKPDFMFGSSKRWSEYTFFKWLETRSNSYR